jgi:acylphosphatase
MSVKMGAVSNHSSMATPPATIKTTLTTIEQPSPAATPAAPNPARSSGEGRLVTVHPPGPFYRLRRLSQSLRGIKAKRHYNSWYDRTNTSVEYSPEMVADLRRDCMTRRVRLRIKGNVQGVGFRIAAAELARSHGLTGYIFNEPDGSVTVEAEGEDPEISEFILWCRHGPRGAEVREIVEDDLPVQGDRSFEITRAPYQADVD